MKRYMEKIEDMLTATALVEIEGFGAIRELIDKYDIMGEIDKDFTAIAFTDAGELDAAQSILHEAEGLHRDREVVAPDDCQYGDNDLCFVQE